MELVRSVASDPLIPLITTVPSNGTSADALAFVIRQQSRLATGAGYSFAIADARTDEAVGQMRSLKGGPRPVTGSPHSFVAEGTSAKHCRP